MSQFVVTISACPRRRGFVAMGAHRSEHIPARVLGPMYRDAVIAEMSETVRTAVAIKLNSNEEAWANGLEVRLGSAVRGMRFGEVTNLGMSYMFELRDAVNEVIRTFEPPPEAWVDDMTVAAPPGVASMSPNESPTIPPEPAPPQPHHTHIHTLPPPSPAPH